MYFSKYLGLNLIRASEGRRVKCNRSRAPLSSCLMAFAQTSTIYQTCNCYKIPGLIDPILETTQIAFLHDRYVLREELGWGQFGVIRACSDLLTREALACKSIAKDRLISAEDLQSVKLEIEIMARLSGHPNVVGLKAVYEDKSSVHLVMELCAGGELFHRLEKHGGFAEPDACILFRDLMEVVMYCHDNGIVHRDLKPENILLATKSKSSQIKLADFGLATYIKPGQSLCGTVGSPFYIAPEVLAGGYNQAADVWSAGVILYILLSGMPPFWGKTKSRIFDAVRSAELQFPADPWDQISALAKELVSGMLRRDPTQRLTAPQVLDHSWMKNCAQKRELGSSSIPAPPLMSGGRDLSFGLSSPGTCDAPQNLNLIATSLKSSFSAFLIDTTNGSPTVGFSFDGSSQNSCTCGDQESSSPIPSLPSFAFFSPLNEQETSLAPTIKSTEINTIKRDSSFGKLFKSLVPPNGREPEHKRPEVRRGVAISSRAIGIHSKRNHTIGLGELEQLDLMISDSIIRWVSCTHLPSTHSLRSSLVC